MAFQIKDFASITASCINWMRASTRKITDFHVGSRARTLIEAPAIEIDQLYQEMFHGLKESIPVSTYRTFEFDRLGAAPSAGVLTFYADGGQTSAILVEAGTRVRNPGTGTVYETLQNLTIPTGAVTGVVPAQATAPGSVTNADIGAINELVSNIDGVVGVENLSPFVSGRDRETDEQRKLRFAAFVQTLSRGTLAAVRYGAESTVLRDGNGIVVERVAYAGIIEPYEDDPVENLPGFVQVYIHNGVGSTSPQLVSEVQRVVDGYYLDDGTPVPGWKAAGVTVDVYAATEVAVGVTGSLDILPGFQQSAVIAAATDAVGLYLMELTVGDEAVLAEIIRLIKQVEGVYDVTLAAPSANVEVARSEKVVPGTIALVAS